MVDNNKGQQNQETSNNLNENFKPVFSPEDIAAITGADNKSNHNLNHCDVNPSSIYGGFWRRVVAFIIDDLVIYFVAYTIAVVLSIFGITIGLDPSQLIPGTFVIDWEMTALSVSITVLYFGLME